MPAPKKASPDTPTTSVCYVTLDGVCVARSATEADAKAYIDELTKEEGGIARVRANHGMPAEGAYALAIRPGAEGEVY